MYEISKQAVLEPWFWHQRRFWPQNVPFCALGKSQEKMYAVHLRPRRAVDLMNVEDYYPGGKRRFVRLKP